MLFFPIASNVPQNLLYSPQSNITRKTSSIQLLRFETQLSVWYDHTALYCEIWLQTSTFSAWRTMHFYDQNCFSATFQSFHIVGLLSNTLPKKWLAPHGSTQRRYVEAWQLTNLSVHSVAGQNPQEKICGRPENPQQKPPEIAYILFDRAIEAL